MPRSSSSRSSMASKVSMHSSQLVSMSSSVRGGLPPSCVGAPSSLFRRAKQHKPHTPSATGERGERSAATGAARRRTSREARGHRQPVSRVRLRDPRGGCLGSWVALGTAGHSSATDRGPSCNHTLPPAALHAHARKSGWGGGSTHLFSSAMIVGVVWCGVARALC